MEPKKLLTDKNENKKIKEAAWELFELNKKFKNIQEQYEAKKEKLTLEINNFMFINNVDAFSFLSDKFSKAIKFEVKKIKQRKIKFNIEAIEKKLDKELVSELIDKTYTINDMEGLIKYLKECGVNPKKFKSFISVDKKVNQKRLEQLGELGDININDLKGCYTVVENKGYIKITEKEMEEE